MKNRFMATAAIVAILAATGAARADSGDIASLKAQSAALKKQNAALEKRLNKLEKKQAQTQAAAPARSFVAADLGSIKGPLPAPSCVMPSLEGPLTFCGITLFGTFDGGVGYATHAAPANPDLYFGNVAVNKANNRAATNFVPSGLSQTGLGIKGAEEIMPGVSGIFMASTGINPQSGHLANATGSLVDNNGLPLNAQSLNAGGTRGGQAFNDELYAGVATKDFGQLTFGRQKTLENEMLQAYDPAGYSYNYSLIGLSGTPIAGGGFTDNGRLDDVMKYKIVYGAVHFGAMYKFADGSAGELSTAQAGAKKPYCGDGVVNYSCSTANWAYQFDGGATYAGFNIDVVGGHYNQAMSAGLLGTNVPGDVGMTTVAGKAAQIDDIAVAANYTWNQFKFFAGWADDVLRNPSDPIGFGATGDQGNYVISSVTNNAYVSAEILMTEWVGVKYAWDPRTEFTVAYYHEGQNNYGGVANTAAVCNAPGSFVGTYNKKVYNTPVTGSGPRSSSCAGGENFVSGYVDYHFTKRFDAYAGLTVSEVYGGMAAGFPYTTDVAPTVGIRYKF